MDEYRLRVAARLMAANPSITYTVPAPEPLLAIPVLEIEVDADGNVCDIRVVRAPEDATDTVQIAIDAVRRAAPFGDASHCPPPWKFVETFLFDDQRRFKPRILD
jgi:protein TonB